MFKKGLLLALSGALLSILGAVVAHAQTARTFVSTSGMDTNPCTVSSPCRTIATAIAAISPSVTSGEVYCLTSGGYGSVTINRGVAIICDRVDAALTAPAANGTAVTIAAGSSNVALNGLHVQGTGTGGVGINITSAGAVLIENSSIGAFNGTPGVGIQIAPSAGAKVTVNNCDVVGNGVGISASDQNSSGAGAVSVSVTNSLVGGNTGTAISAIGVASGTGISLDHSQVTGNGTALSATGAALIRFGTSLISGNPGYMTAQSGAAITSAGDNHVTDNNALGANTSVYTYLGTQ